MTRNIPKYWLGLLETVKTRVAVLAARHVFRGQKKLARRQQIDVVHPPIYFRTDRYLSAISAALRLIAETDKSAISDIRKHVCAFVELSPNVNIAEMQRTGMLIGVYYDFQTGDSGIDLETKRYACAIVQFASCHKMLVNLDKRCRLRRDAALLNRVKRISIERMLKFTIRAEFDGRYSYEIECKLKNGSFGC